MLRDRIFYIFSPLHETLCRDTVTSSDDINKNKLVYSVLDILTISVFSSNPRENIKKQNECQQRGDSRMHPADHFALKPLSLCRRAIKKCCSLVETDGSLYVATTRSRIFLVSISFFVAAHRGRPCRHSYRVVVAFRGCVPCHRELHIWQWLAWPSIRAVRPRVCSRRKFIDKTRCDPDVFFKASVNGSLRETPRIDQGSNG